MGKKTLMFVGAHMDDCESAGGLMFKAIDAGHRVVLVNTVGDLSNRRELGGRHAKATRDLMALTRRIGAERILMKYAYLHVMDGLEARTEMVRILAHVRPDIVVNVHQPDDWSNCDHAASGRIVLAALRSMGLLLGGADLKAPGQVLTTCHPKMTDSNLMGYAPDEGVLSPDVFIDVTPYVKRIVNLRRDLDAIMSPSVPRSKFYRMRVRMLAPPQGCPAYDLRLTLHAETQFARMRAWGRQCGVPFAEAYRSSRKRPMELW